MEVSGDTIFVDYNQYYMREIKDYDSSLSKSGEVEYLINGIADRFGYLHVCVVKFFEWQGDALPKGNDLFVCKGMIAKKWKNNCKVMLMLDFAGSTSWGFAKRGSFSLVNTDPCHEELVLYVANGPDVLFINYVFRGDI